MLWIKGFWRGVSTVAVQLASHVFLLLLCLSQSGLLTCLAHLGDTACLFGRVAAQVGHVLSAGMSRLGNILPSLVGILLCSLVLGCVGGCLAAGSTLFQTPVLRGLACLYFVGWCAIGVSMGAGAMRVVYGGFGRCGYCRWQAYWSLVARWCWCSLLAEPTARTSSAKWCEGIGSVGIAIHSAVQARQGHNFCLSPACQVC